MSYEQFDRSLDTLVNGDSSERLDSLLQIHDITVSDSEECRKLISNRANPLLQTLYLVLKMVFERPRQEVSMKFVNYFLNMTHKLCSLRAFLRVSFISKET